MGKGIPAWNGTKFPKFNANDPAKSQNPLTPKTSQGPQTFPAAKFGSGLDTKDPHPAYNPKPISGKGAQTYMPGHRFGNTLDTTDRPMSPKK